MVVILFVYPCMYIYIGRIIDIKYKIHFLLYNMRTIFRRSVKIPKKMHRRTRSGGHKHRKFPENPTYRHNHWWEIR